MSTLPKIVLVRGAWVDGSSRSAVVIERLQADDDVAKPIEAAAEATAG